MATLDRYVVDVTVNMLSSTVNRRSFIPLILGASTQTNRTKIWYASEWTGTDPLSELTALQEAMITRIFAQPTYPRYVKTGKVEVGDADVGAALDAIKAYDDDWYYILNEDRGDADIALISTWVNVAANQPRLAVLQSDDATVTAFAAITTATEKRVVGAYHDLDTEYVDAGWCGFAGGINPDQQSVSWCPRTITGITPLQTELTGALLATLRAAYVNYYGTLAGQGAMYDGKTLDDIFIDAQISADWLAIRISEDVQQLILDYGNNGLKMPYDDSGFAIVESVVRKRLKQGVKAQHIKDNYTIELPTLTVGADNEVLSADKAARLMRFTINAETTGAIQRVAITLNVEAV